MSRLKCYILEIITSISNNSKISPEKRNIMLYFNFVPLDLKDILLLYIPDKDIDTMMGLSEFTNSFSYRHGRFWKLKMQNHYPQDFKENMPFLYYKNKTIQNIIKELERVSWGIEENYKLDCNYLKAKEKIKTYKLRLDRLKSKLNRDTKYRENRQVCIDTLNLQLNNVKEEKEHIKEKYKNIATLYAYPPRLQYYVEHPMTLQNLDGKYVYVTHNFIFKMIQTRTPIQRDLYSLLLENDHLDRLTKQDILNNIEQDCRLCNGLLLTLTSTDSLGRINVKYGTLYINIYVFKSSNSEYDFDYSKKPLGKMVFPTRFLQDMKQLAISGRDIWLKYQFPFNILESDAYQ